MKTLLTTALDLVEEQRCVRRVCTRLSSGWCFLSHFVSRVEASLLESRFCLWCLDQGSRRGSGQRFAWCHSPVTHASGDPSMLWRCDFLPKALTGTSRESQGCFEARLLNELRQCACSDWKGSSPASLQLKCRKPFDGKPRPCSPARNQVLYSSLNRQCNRFPPPWSTADFLSCWIVCVHLWHLSLRSTRTNHNWQEAMHC